MADKGHVLLIISGGIAAYKSLELIRLLRQNGVLVRCILTRAGEKFVTPTSVSALSEAQVRRDLFSLGEEAEMDHISLTRWADLVVVAPASADLMARMALGLASDLATTALLASNKPVLVAPAMNVRMWLHPATMENVRQLRVHGASFIGPDDGDMACGEFGPGRMAEPSQILAAIMEKLGKSAYGSELEGRCALVTAGATREPIDPLRYLSNRSSGRQGYAIACALAERGARVVLVSGPSELADPFSPNIRIVRVETAEMMWHACEEVLPVDIAICVAAVADWRPRILMEEKIKKQGKPPCIELVENPDILARLAQGAGRPSLVVGFAAETENILAAARAKRKRKGCDWLLANQASGPENAIGAMDNQVILLTEEGEESWPRMDKQDLARRLAGLVAARLGTHYAPSS